MLTHEDGFHTGQKTGSFESLPRWPKGLFSEVLRAQARRLVLLLLLFSGGDGKLGWQASVRGARSGSSGFAFFPKNIWLNLRVCGALVTTTTGRNRVKFEPLGRTFHTLILGVYCSQCFSEPIQCIHPTSHPTHVTLPHTHPIHASLPPNLPLHPPTALIATISILRPHHPPRHRMRKNLTLDPKPHLRLHVLTDLLPQRPPALRTMQPARRAAMARPTRLLARVAVRVVAA